MLGDKIDQQVQDNITATRANVGIINTTIISSIRNAALLSQDKSRHIDHGGDVYLTRHWAASVMHRMGLVKRRGCSTAKPEITNYEELKTQYLSRIKKAVNDNNIPDELVIIWDNLYY